VRLRGPVVILLHIQRRDSRLLDAKHTRSSSNSASELNLFTKLLNPMVPLRPRAVKGFNLESSADSRKTIRGYAMGTPVDLYEQTDAVIRSNTAPSCTTRCFTSGDSSPTRLKTLLYSKSLQTWSFLLSALVTHYALADKHPKLCSGVTAYRQSSMRIRTWGPM
jgi:hypothetical protein